MIKEQWLIISDYAKKYGISKQAVWGRIHRGTLKKRLGFKKMPVLEVLDEVTRQGLAQNVVKKIK